MPGFAHLAARTCFSLRDGVMKPRALAQAVAERGMDVIGVADRDGLYGAVRLADACHRVGIRAVFGADLALQPDLDGGGAGRPGWGASRGSPLARGGFAGPGSGPAWLGDDAARVTLVAATDAGYAALARLVSDAHLDRERGDPHLAWTRLQQRAGTGTGLFVLLGDDSPVARLVDAGAPDAAEAEARRWLDVVGRDRLLIGVTHHLAPGDDARARARFALADRLGLRAVADQRPRYLDPGDARVADVVEAVRQQVPLGPRHSSRRNAEGYLKTPEQMASVFAERPDALRNAADVADACRVDLGLGRLRVPDYVALGEHARAELRQRCEAGLHDRYGHVSGATWDLLDRELQMVARLGLDPYFLTVSEIMDRIREKGVMAACRGSAAGSLVAWALRISDVDPVAHDLVFERFMNPYRDELPDIDIDVESARREDIYADLLDRYGPERVACVCMVETFKARMAIREVGKTLGLPASEVDHLAKSFPHIRAGDVRAALEHLPELQGLADTIARSAREREDLRLLLAVVERLDGFPRHVALHPSGVLLGDGNLRDLVPVERSAAGFAMAQFDKDDVEALGLCKLDVLAVRMLSSMAHCRDEVRRVRGDEIDFDRVAWNDQPTYELIRSTRTLGMFQIESPGQRELVGKFQPEHLSDLVVDISLFRPGPVKGDMVGPFLQRRLGQSKAVPPHPLLERALGETFGVIVYHEQVMRSVAALTGCDLAHADLVRRRLGDPEQAAEIGEWLKAGAAERGVPADVADRLWTALAQFASFGFCKAHAAAFSVPTYRSAWLKRHYLPEFVAGLLTHDPGMYPRRLLLEDARQFGVCVLPLDVNRSWSDYRVERVAAPEALERLGVRGGQLPPGWRPGPVPPTGLDAGADPDDPEWRFGIRLGLQDVAGIDEHQISGLLAARPFTSVADLRRRATLSQPVAEALAHVGALDGLGAPGASRRDVLLEVSERWSGLRRHRPADPTAPEQLGLLPGDGPPGLPEYTASERTRAELEVLGLDAGRHVLSFYEGLLAVLGVTRTVDLLDCAQGQRVRVAGVKVATQTPPVKSGQRVIFLSLDDATGVNDATFFERVHDRCAWTVFHTWLLVVDGTVHRTGARGVSIKADVAYDLRRLMVAWREGWLPGGTWRAASDPRGFRPQGGGGCARPAAGRHRRADPPPPAVRRAAPGRDARPRRERPPETGLSHARSRDHARVPAAGAPQRPVRGGGLGGGRRGRRRRGPLVTGGPERHHLGRPRPPPPRRRPR